MERESDAQYVAFLVAFVSHSRSCTARSEILTNSVAADYTWYNLLQSLTYVDPTTLHGSTPVIPNTPAAFLLWTRRDSKIDWRARFASIYAPIVVEEGADELNEEGMTMKEEREERWREENEGLAREGEDKGAMREYYKVRSSCMPSLSRSFTQPFESVSDTVTRTDFPWSLHRIWAIPR